jgi:hypothetical protein
MRRTPVVMGVLSMVFGGVQVLMTGVGLVSQPFSKQMMGGMGKALSGLPRQQGQPDMAPMFERLAKVMDDLKLYTYLTGFAMLSLSITLIIVGWTLYRRRAQSRQLTIAWAVAALAYLPVQIWVQVKVILPRTQQVTKAMLEGTNNQASGLMDSMMGVQSIGTVIFYLLFYAPFPILLLILIGRQSTKNDLLPATI